MTEAKSSSKRSSFLKTLVIGWAIMVFVNPPSGEGAEWFGTLLSSGLVAGFFALVVLGIIWVVEKFEPAEEEAGSTGKASVGFIMLSAAVWFMTFFWLAFSGPLGVPELGWIFLGVCVIGLIPTGDFFNRPFITRIKQSSLAQNRIVIWILKQAPLIPTVLEFRTDLTTFYTEHKRKNLLYYYIIPLVILSALFGSERARAELKVLMVPVYIVVSALLMLNGLAYVFDYGPHLGLADLFWMTNGVVAFCVVLTLIATPPLTATTGELLARKQSSVLAVLLVFGTLGLSLGGWALGDATHLGDGRHETVASLQLTNTRLSRPGFRDELAAHTQDFLLPRECTRETQEGAFVRVDLTRDYQVLLEGIMSLDETGYFKVVELSPPESSAACRLGVLSRSKPEHLDGKGYDTQDDTFDHQTGAIVLFVRQGDDFYRSWGRLPRELQELGEFPKSSDGFEANGRYLYDGVLVRTRAQFALMDEYTKRATGFGIGLLGRRGIIGIRGTPSDCPDGWTADLSSGNCMPPENTQEP